MKPEKPFSVKSSHFGTDSLLHFLALVVSLKPLMFHIPAVDRGRNSPWQIPGTRVMFKQNHFQFTLSISCGFQGERCNMLVFCTDH